MLDRWLRGFDGPDSTKSASAIDRRDGISDHCALYASDADVVIVVGLCAPALGSKSNAELRSIVCSKIERSDGQLLPIQCDSDLGAPQVDGARLNTPTC